MGAEHGSSAKSSTVQPAARTARPLTAAQRTVCIPGVDLREQDNRNAPPNIARLVVRRAVFRIPNQAHPETHLAWETDLRPMCGRETVGAERYETPGKICMACRAEASKQRAVVR